MLLTNRPGTVGVFRARAAIPNLCFLCLLLLISCLLTPSRIAILPDVLDKFGRFCHNKVGH